MPINLGGSGGVVSTSADMIRFLDALLVSETLLSPEMLALITDYRDADNRPSGDGNGLGLGASELKGQHFGGFSAACWASIWAPSCMWKAAPSFRSR
ncbi:serine hydrolase domain-containing protein [Ruegeria aquimaris]|uniref:hypothetical protein n=1 Tax=Ruegeria aquimaris TaxID=2984333 RepID=UPI002980DFC5|nr:hypothetical protein [Ruegeria sp. XHP0148]